MTRIERIGADKTCYIRRRDAACSGQRSNITLGVRCYGRYREAEERGMGVKAAIIACLYVGVSVLALGEGPPRMM